MPRLAFTPHLKRFFPKLDELEVEATTVAEALALADARHPGLRAYVVDDHGRLRKHVNIFIGSRAVRDRDALGDALEPGARLYVFQALSGG